MTTRNALVAVAAVFVTAMPLAAAHGGHPVRAHAAECKPNASVMLKGTPLSAATVDDVAAARVTAQP